MHSFLYYYSVSFYIFKWSTMCGSCSNSYREEEINKIKNTARKNIRTESKKFIYLAWKKSSINEKENRIMLKEDQDHVTKQDQDHVTKQDQDLVTLANVTNSFTVGSKW